MPPSVYDSLQRIHPSPVPHWTYTSTFPSHLNDRVRLFRDFAVDRAPNLRKGLSGPKRSNWSILALDPPFHLLSTPLTPYSLLDYLLLTDICFLTSYRHDSNDLFRPPPINTASPWTANRVTPPVPGLIRFFAHNPLSYMHLCSLYPPLILPTPAPTGTYTSLLPTPFPAGTYTTPIKTTRSLETNSSPDIAPQRSHKVYQFERLPELSKRSPRPFLHLSPSDPSFIFSALYTGLRRSHHPLSFTNSAPPQPKTSRTPTFLQKDPPHAFLPSFPALARPPPYPPPA